MSEIFKALEKELLMSDNLQQTMLQVVLAAQEVSKDARALMHQEVTHYLVGKDIIDQLNQALLSYRKANEDYLVDVAEISATPSTPEM